MVPVDQMSSHLVSKWGYLEQRWKRKEQTTHALYSYGKTCIPEKSFYAFHHLEAAFARQSPT